MCLVCTYRKVLRNYNGSAGPLVLAWHRGFTIESMIRRVIFFLFFLVFVGVAFLTTLGAYRAFTCKHWPVTDGVVIAFYETPQYRYSVGGSSHTNDVVSCNEFVNRWVATKNSARYATKYPLGANIRIHYLSNQPEIAVLETEFDPSVLPALGVLYVVCIGLGLGFLRSSPGS